MKMIGLGGLKGCGKSTIAQHLQLVLASEGVTAMTISFATPMKLMMEALLRHVGMTQSEMRFAMTEGKEIEIYELSSQTPRRMLQTLGTEWGRDSLDPDFWVNIADIIAENSRADVVIFDDVRFENEADMIQVNGGKVIRLTRDGLIGSDGHVSEAMSYPTDHVVENNDDPLRVARIVWETFNQGT